MDSGTSEINVGTFIPSTGAWHFSTADVGTLSVAFSLLRPWATMTTRRSFKALTPRRLRLLLKFEEHLEEQDKSLRCTGSDASLRPPIKAGKLSVATIPQRRWFPLNFRSNSCDNWLRGSKRSAESWIRAQLGRWGIFPEWKLMVRHGVWRGVRH